MQYREGNLGKEKDAAKRRNREFTEKPRKV